jgi:hypothetical protein
MPFSASGKRFNLANEFMNKEMLERLLLDRALGQLAPDVEELLQEQLLVDPAAARMADELAATVTLATALMKRPVATVPCRTPIQTVIRREQTRRMLAIAASFAIGATVTLCGMRALTPPQRQIASGPAPEPAARVPQASAPPAAVERAVRTLPFWSHQRIYALASAARQANANEPQR